jgi:Uma2 family endonuclease
MTALLQPPPLPAATPAPAPYRLSVDQYDAMVKHGILTENDPVELIRGLLVQKMSKNSPHRIATSQALPILIGVLPPTRWHLQTQDPIRLPDSSPEPDHAVIRGRPNDYRTSHPTARDIGLVVEVADTSLAYDRGEKKALYAEARIPTYWIVNLIDGVLELYTNPQGTGDQADYANVQRLGATDSVVIVLDGVSLPAIAVRDLLP